MFALALKTTADFILPGLAKARRLGPGPFPPKAHDICATRISCSLGRSMDSWGAYQSNPSEHTTMPADEHARPIRHTCQVSRVSPKLRPRFEIIRLIAAKIEVAQALWFHENPTSLPPRWGVFGGQPQRLHIGACRNPDKTAKSQFRLWFALMGWALQGVGTSEHAWLAQDLKMFIRPPERLGLLEFLACRRRLVGRSSCKSAGRPDGMSLQILAL